MDTQEKRILILHASAGYGHAKAASALACGIKLDKPKAIVEVIDSLDGFPWIIKKIYVQFYLILIHHFPAVWGWFYEMTDSTRFSGFRSFMRRLFNGGLGFRLERYIREQKFDVIFCTHFMPCEMLAHLRRKGRLGARFVTVVTDFLVHQLWIFAETDFYAVAMEATKKDLIRQGIPESKIVITGIPIDPKFSQIHIKEELAPGLHIDPKRPAVLLTSGGTGSGPMREIVQRLVEAVSGVQILVVSGRNESLLEEMKELAVKMPNIIPFGFVDNMDELMDAADVVVGKAGGLTLSEALAKEKPFCILSPVPGQEVRNAQTLTDLGAAFWIKETDDLIRNVSELLNSYELRTKMRRQIQTIGAPDSARMVARIGWQA